MKLSKVIFSEEIVDSNFTSDIEISGIVSDSRKAYEGCVFVAINGETRNGNNYINEAAKKGATVIITEENIVNEDVFFIKVSNIRSIYSKMCSRYYDAKTNNMKVIAITGTNGKTTTAHYIYNILCEAGEKCGLISTTETIILNEIIDLGGGSEVQDKFSAMTTPDPAIIYNLINKMKEKGVKYLIIEASSHAIKQGRLDGIENIDYAVFTNLSKEHLDYHKTMEDYFKTKELLIKRAKNGVINGEDYYGKILTLKYEHMSSVSFDKKNPCNVEIICEDENGAQFVVFLENKQIKLFTKLLGVHNVLNASLAALVANDLKMAERAIIDGIKKTEVKGRMEKVFENIYIDYAHTPLATEKTLSTVKNIAKDKKIVAIFGCGGDRDKSKRKEIGKIVSKYADIAIVTSDNPRNEEPLEIIKDIIIGIDRNKAHIVIPNRKDAILYAVKNLINESTILVLLGKGHEKYQIDATGKHYFDEIEIIKEGLTNV